MSLHNYISGFLLPLQILKMVRHILPKGKTLPATTELTEFFFSIEIFGILSSIGIQPSICVKTMQILSYAILKDYKKEEKDSKLLYNLFVSAMLERMDNVIKKWQKNPKDDPYKYLGLFYEFEYSKLLPYIVNKDGRERIKVNYTHGKPPQIGTTDEELRKFVIDCLKDEYSYENAEKLEGYIGPRPIASVPVAAVGIKPFPPKRQRLSDEK